MGIDHSSLYYYQTAPTASPLKNFIIWVVWIASLLYWNRVLKAATRIWGRQLTCWIIFDNLMLNSGNPLPYTNTKEEEQRIFTLYWVIALVCVLYDPQSAYIYICIPILYYVLYGRSIDLSFVPIALLFSAAVGTVSVSRVIGLELIFIAGVLFAKHYIHNPINIWKNKIWVFGLLVNMLSFVLLVWAHWLGIGDWDLRLGWKYCPDQTIRFLTHACYIGKYTLVFSYILRDFYLGPLDLKTFATMKVINVVAIPPVILDGLYIYVNASTLIGIKIFITLPMIVIIMYMAGLIHERLAYFLVLWLIFWCLIFFILNSLF